MTYGMPYPIECLPSIPRRCASEVSERINSPIELAAASVIAAGTAAAQRNCKVTIKDGFSTHLSQFQIAIAPSGERKSQCVKIIFQSTHEWQQKQFEIEKTQKPKYEAKHNAWQHIKKELDKELRRAYRNNESTEEIEQRQIEHFEQAPAAWTATRTIFEDTTIEALAQGLHKGGGSGILLSDEFGQFAKSQAANKIPTLNCFWDGRQVHVDRKNSDSFTLAAPKLSLYQLSQPETFAAFLRSKSDIARDSGFLARVLFTIVESSQGTRREKGFNSKSEALNIFHNRITELYSSTEERNLILSEDAQRLWIEISNKYEKLMSPNQIFSKARDFASKAPEHVARMAAVFHAFENDSNPEITTEYISCADKIIEWHGYQFLRIINNELTLESDAEELLNWLKAQPFEQFFGAYISTILQCGPGRFRKKAALDPVIEYLRIKGRIHIDTFQGKRRALVTIPPQFTYPQLSVPIQY